MTLGPAPRVALVALVATALLLALAPTGSARKISDDPVRLTITAPAKVPLKKRFAVSVRIDADPGALDIASQPLALHVLFEPECGGSFEGSAGTAVIDRPLPAQSAGTAFSFTARGRSAMRNFTPQSLCVFVTDADQRQYVTSTNVEVTATKSCTRTTRNLARFRKAVKKAKGDRRAHLKSRARRAAKARKKACPAPAASDG